MATSPIVSLLPATDTVFCPGDSILLTGATGGTLQWFKDGIMIPGANESTYYASEVGIYNQLKTNTSGCSDSSNVGILLTEASPEDCGIGITEMDFTASVEIYPVPTTDQLNISLDIVESGNPYHSYLWD